MPEDDSTELLILGLGNILCEDDGLGIAAVDVLRQEYRIPEEVRLLDGGTLGLSLLSHMRQGEATILVDAIQADAPPGTLIRLDGEQVAPAVRSRLSVHQIGVADLLDALRLLDEFPRQIPLLALVPESMELAVKLSPAVAAALPQLVAAVVEESSALGHPLEPVVANEETSRSRHRLAYSELQP
jgi:hydrogenase maturation protease